MTLGERIRELRLNHPVWKSLRQFATQLGKSPSWVSKVERDLEKPGRDSLIQIARLLNVEAAELLQLAERFEPDVEAAIMQRYSEVSGLLRTISTLDPRQIKELEAEAERLKRQKPDQKQTDDLLMVSPPTFVVRQLHVSWMEDAAIAAIADRLRADFVRETASPCPPICPETLIWEFLDERDRLTLITENSLGLSEEGHKIAGKMTVADEDGAGGFIYIDPMFVDSPLYPFTLAHEIGHWILHRRFIIQARQQLSLFDERPCETVTLERSLQGSRGKLPPEEWQANRFAAHLLMPSELVREEFATRFGEAVCLEEESKRKTFASFGGDLDAYALQIAETPRRVNGTIKLGLASVFKVSKKAMAIRLQELGLVYSETNTSTRLF